MKTIRRTRIIAKTRELLATRSTAGNGENRAQTICPLCRNPLASALPLAATESSAVSTGTDKQTTELPAEHDCSEIQK